jgi:hypothetical protein
MGLRGGRRKGGRGREGGEEREGKRGRGREGGEGGREGGRNEIVFTRMVGKRRDARRQSRTPKRAD